MSLNSNSILTSEVATQAVNNGLHMFSDDFFSAGGMKLHQMMLPSFLPILWQQNLTVLHKH